MDIKIGIGSVIQHNKHILAVSGGNFAILNPGDLNFMKHKEDYIER